MNETAIFWLVLTVLLGIIEISTPTLVCIWPAIGGLLTFGCAMFGVNIWIQIAVFVITTVILIILTRPLAKKYVTNKVTATNADRIIGTEGVVIQNIDPIENSGQVKVMGQIWSAKSENGTPIQSGVRVAVTALEGVKVVVKAK